MLEVWARVLCGESILQLLALASSEVCGKDRSGKAFGLTWTQCPNLDPMDSVRLRTASMESNVPGKYGPHGELFFFLIQKEPATMPGSETFSPFFNAGIHTPFSLLMSSRSARLSPCT